ncbi:MAG TPA: hypothetical protein PKC91_08110 [Ignavibacteria bacterium]|nr:hypothetical protein [Ignavibacteria bacterium]
MKINNKNFLVCAVIVLCFVLSNPVFSQSLQFCEDVSKDGVPISASSVFNISTKGGYLKCLTTLPYRINTSSVYYEVYKIDSDGYETYDNTIYQEVDPSWTWFWKEITFYDEGRYNINVYDSEKNFLATAQIRIQYY